MVLSNVERQRRYRERLKAKAAGLDLAERARDVMMAAIQTVWTLAHEGNFADFDGLEKLDDWFVYLRDPKRHGENVADLLREYFTNYLDVGNGDQRAVLQRAIDLIDAVTLRNVAE